MKKLGILFTKRGMEAHAMVTSDNEFGELVNKFFSDVVKKSATHHVEPYDHHNQTFTVTKKINP